MSKYQSLHSDEERKTESAKLLQAWNNKIPIVFEKMPNSKLEALTSQKLLCPKHYTFQQLLQGLRMKIKLSKESALFVFLNRKELVTGDRTMISIYETSKDPDGFLYLYYCEHPTLG